MDIGYWSYPKREEAIRASATPEKHQELARIQAITGKTCNHPALAHSRMFVRNAEETACKVLAEKKE